MYLPAGLDRLDITGLLGDPGDGHLLFLMTFLLLLLVTAAGSTERPGHSGTVRDPQRAAIRSDLYCGTNRQLQHFLRDINANIVPCMCVVIRNV